MMCLVAVAFAGCGGSNDEVRFQNASDPGPKPFTPPTDVPNGSKKVSASQARSEVRSIAQGKQSNPDVVGGDTVCDREKLVSALATDTDKLKAWGEVAGGGTDVQSVAKFIRGLKPSTLSRDTQVTSHSYENGEAKAYQAILTKGTAVLADDGGKPVARCASGSPLADPGKLAAETKCVGCPPGYQPGSGGGGSGGGSGSVTDKCTGDCTTPASNPPPVKPPTAPPAQPDDVFTARAALDACRLERGGAVFDCTQEYERTRKLCESDPLNSVCDVSVCSFVSPSATFNGSSCGSYLNDAQSKAVCNELPDDPNCVRSLEEARERCGRRPALCNSPILSTFRAKTLRARCVTNPTRPECGRLQADCAKTPTAVSCMQLRQTCTDNPNRPDCKAAEKILKEEQVTPAAAGDPADQQPTTDTTEQTPPAETDPNAPPPDQGGDTGGGGQPEGGQQPTTPQPTTPAPQPEDGQQP